MSSDSKIINPSGPASPNTSVARMENNHNVDQPEFGEGKMVTEADNLVTSDTDPDAAQFMTNRNK